MDITFEGMDREQVERELEHRTFEEGLEEFRRGIVNLRNTALQLPVYQPPVEWIYDNIRLTEKESSRPGQMRLSVYQREMANCLNDDENVRQVTVLKGVQIGYSKGLAAIWAYFVSHRAINASVVFPTIPDVKRYYKTEIAKLFSRVKDLKKIVRVPTKGDIFDTWYEQHFLNGVDSFFRGAHNDDQLQSYTAQFNAGDEIDRSGWQPSATSIGDKIAQLRNRATDFLFPKLLLGSTPGLLHLSLIWKEWLRSDQRKLVVRCPHCQHPQVMKWGDGKKPFGFRWDLDANGKVEKAWYMCEGPKHCRIDEDLKEDMIDAGEYVPTVANPIDPKHVGIHAPSWISMSPGAAWTLLAQQWLNAQGDVELLKEFVMFKMAEPWDDLESKVLNEETVEQQRKPYPAEVPDDVVVLTAGGDDQENKEGNELEKQASREIAIVGWTRHEQYRVIGHWVIPGEVGDAEADRMYRELLARPFTKRDGTKLFVQATAMDMGGTHTDQTRSFAATFRANQNVWAIKGNNNEKGKRKPTIFPVKPSRSAKGLRFYTVDSQQAKDAVARKMLQTGDDGPMFPKSMPPNYMEKLTCEKRDRQKNGGYWWNPKKGRRAEEEWMCLVYAYIALKGLRMKYRRWNDLNVAADEMGIGKLPPHDPETGEIGYSGPDLSAMSGVAQVADTDASLSQVLVSIAEQAKDAQPGKSLATSSSGSGAPVRKRRRGGVVRSSY